MPEAFTPSTLPAALRALADQVLRCADHVEALEATIVRFEDEAERLRMRIANDQIRLEQAANPPRAHVQD